MSADAGAQSPALADRMAQLVRQAASQPKGADDADHRRALEERVDVAAGELQSRLNAAEAGIRNELAGHRALLDRLEAGLVSLRDERSAVTERVDEAAGLAVLRTEEIGAEVIGRVDATAADQGELLAGLVARIDELDVTVDNRLQDLASGQSESVAGLREDLRLGLDQLETSLQVKIEEAALALAETLAHILNGSLAPGA